MPPPVKGINESDDLKTKGMNLSNCMLEQSMGTVVGVAVGLAVGVTTKKVKPFILLSTAGTAADLGYGYFNACTELIDDYLLAKAKAAAPKGGASASAN